MDEYSDEYFDDYVYDDLYYDDMCMSCQHFIGGVCNCEHSTCKGNVGSYTLRVTERVFANYVNINKTTITLEKGVTYELPITPNYTYRCTRTALFFFNSF